MKIFAGTSATVCAFASRMTEPSNLDCSPWMSNTEYLSTRRKVVSDRQSASSCPMPMDRLFASQQCALYGRRYESTGNASASPPEPQAQCAKSVGSHRLPPTRNSVIRPGCGAQFSTTGYRAPNPLDFCKLLCYYPFAIPPPSQRRGITGVPQA